MGTKNNPGRFDCYAHADPDEPMFILLGRDPAASHIVRMWASMRAREFDDLDKLDEARACADAMEAWARKLGKGARVDALGKPGEPTHEHEQRAKVIVLAEGDDSIVLRCEGGSFIELERDNGLHLSEWLLDGPPKTYRGIFVWEGLVTWYPGDESEPSYEGSWRVPTADELRFLLPELTDKKDW